METFVKFQIFKAGFFLRKKIRCCNWLCECNNDVTKAHSSGYSHSLNEFTPFKEDIFLSIFFTVQVC